MSKHTPDSLMRMIRESQHRYAVQANHIALEAALNEVCAERDALRAERDGLREALEFAERRIARMLTLGHGNPLDGEALDAIRAALARSQP